MTVVPFKRITSRDPVDASSLNPPARDVVQRDDGLWSLGIGEDAPGPFETRSFAEAVAVRRVMRG